MRRIKEIVSPERLWNPLLFRTLQLVAVPALILLAAALAVAASHALPRSLSGLIGVGPYIVLLLGTAISAWFNRSRALIMLASLLAAYAGYSLASDLGRESFALRAVLTAFAVLVPFNVLLALAFPERGVRQYRNYRWVLLGLAEILVVIWIAYAGRSSLSGTAWRDVLDHWLLRSPPTPIVARIMLVAAFAAALARTWPRRGPKELRREPRPLSVVSRPPRPAASTVSASPPRPPPATPRAPGAPGAPTPGGAGVTSRGRSAAATPARASCCPRSGPRRPGAWAPAR